MWIMNDYGPCLLWSFHHAALQPYHHTALFTCCRAADSADVLGRQCTRLRWTFLLAFLQRYIWHSRIPTAAKRLAALHMLPRYED